MRMRCHLAISIPSKNLGLPFGLSQKWAQQAPPDAIPEWKRTWLEMQRKTVSLETFNVKEFPVEQATAVLALWAVGSWRACAFELN
jgi:hypothetical protein